jgi:hypothetical protein
MNQGRCSFEQLVAERLAGDPARERLASVSANTGGAAACRWLPGQQRRAAAGAA